MKKEERIDILRNYKNERASYYGIMTIGIFRIDKEAVYA
jgi:hypothetical protein